MTPEERQKERREVWVRFAASAVINSVGSHAIYYADAMLAEYDRRFPINNNEEEK